MRDTKAGFFAGFGMAVLAGGFAVLVMGVAPSQPVDRLAQDRAAPPACEQAACDVAAEARLRVSAL
jgi:hypothetical protein